MIVIADSLGCGIGLLIGVHTVNVLREVPRSAREYLSHAAAHSVHTYREVPIIFVVFAVSLLPKRPPNVWIQSDWGGSGRKYGV